MITDYICKYLISDEFQNELTLINKNYYNLKQEFHIRNAILESINEKGEYIAFAEYPRGNDDAKTIRVDLSVFTGPLKDPFCIELKYHYPKDVYNEKVLPINIENDFKREINFTFNNKTIPVKTALFILIIAEFDIVDSKTKYPSPLSKWQFPINPTRQDQIEKKENWESVLKMHFKNKERELGGILLDPFKIEISKPFKTTYHVYLFERI
jgi:hypothetical protein